MNRHHATLKRLLLIALTAVTLGACRVEDSPVERQIASNRKEIRGRIAADRISEITLSDGTRCAVYYASQSGAIDCNWKP